MRAARPLLGALLQAAAAAAAPLSSSPLQGRQSSIPVGQIIRSCSVPNTIALTFDDGPFEYTDHVLDLLGAAGMKATFFLNGDNFGQIEDYRGTVQRMISDGHQVGSHTWDHPYLTDLDAAAITSEMERLEGVLSSMLGKFPTYMRPPYLVTNGVVLSTLGGLGYHVINVDIDTKDYANQADIQIAADNFNRDLAAGGSISLAHDVHANTANQLVPLLIEAVQRSGKRAVTVGDCLGDPAELWYRTSRAAAAAAAAAADAPLPPVNAPAVSDPTSTGTVSPDNSCGGGSNGYSCPSGQCCSQHGWCGASTAYCGSGCQSGFGVCS